MTAAAWGQLALLVVAILVGSPVLGRYLAAVFGAGPGVVWGGPDDPHPGDPRRDDARLRDPHADDPHVSDPHSGDPYGRVTNGDDSHPDGGGCDGGADPGRRTLDVAARFGPRPAPGDRFFGPVERAVFRIVGIDPRQEQRWNVYALSVVAFGAVSVLALYLLQRVQGLLPLDPTGVGAVAPSRAFNTAVSFATNTDWQSYVPETTVSHLTQMAGLAVQNFLSAAVGLAVAMAFVRGLVRHRSRTLGNFWVDLTRGVVRVLLPLALVAAVVLVAQGVVQNLEGFRAVRTVEGAVQLVPGGPAASQGAIEVLGTNGGGFFGANSAHPFSNPTPFTNLFQIFLMLLIPFSLAPAFGILVGDRRQGRAVFAAMLALWLAVVFAATAFETGGNPRLSHAGVAQAASATGPGGNLEGKEVRFGAAGSALFAASTTSTSTGATDSSHDSFTPGGGGATLVAMMLGEISPGGVGSGLYGMLILALLAVFLAGLMVGRTPEYLGKRIQASEMKLVVLYIVAVPLLVLAFTAITVAIPSGRASILGHGPHGLTEVAYAYTSTANNNGSAFAGLGVATHWYDVTLGLSMLVGRYLLVVPALAVAGSLGRKQAVPPSSGTFPTGTPLFTGLLVAVAVVVVGLTYFPIVALGPIAEQLGIGR